MWPAIALMAVASVASIGGAIIGAGQLRQQGKIEQQLADYRAAIADRSARIKLRDAARAELVSDIAKKRKADEVKRLIGLQRGSLAKGGVLVDDPGLIGAGELVAKTAEAGAVAAEQERNRLLVQAVGFKQESANLEATRDLLAAEGAFKRNQRIVEANTLITSTFTDVAFKWASFGAGGGFGPGGGAPNNPLGTPASPFSGGPV
jgi:hypothetical protein